MIPADWSEIITKLSELATTVSCCCAIPAALLATVIAFVQVRDIKRQLQQTNDHILTSLSNQHNWDLFDHRDDLPRAIPSWDGLSGSERGWAWRTLHLNHLNLLQLAYQDHKRKMLSDHEFENWMRKGRYWFREMASGNEEPELVEGRRVLKQLLDPQEAAFSAEFRSWLIQARILPVDILED